MQLNRVPGPSLKYNRYAAAKYHTGCFSSLRFPGPLWDCWQGGALLKCQGHRGSALQSDLPLLPLCWAAGVCARVLAAVRLCRQRENSVSVAADVTEHFRFWPKDKGFTGNAIVLLQIDMLYSKSCT